jgi:hypothetical protein
MDAEPVAGTALLFSLRARSLRLLRHLLRAWSVNAIPGDGAWTRDTRRAVTLSEAKGPEPRPSRRAAEPPFTLFHKSE